MRAPADARPLLSPPHNDAPRVNAVSCGASWLTSLRAQLETNTTSFVCSFSSVSHFLLFSWSSILLLYVYAYRRTLGLLRKGLFVIVAVALRGPIERPAVRG